MPDVQKEKMDLAEKIDQKPLSKDLIKSLADEIIKIEKMSISTQHSDSQTISCIEKLILEKVRQEIKDEI